MCKIGGGLPFRVLVPYQRTSWSLSSGSSPSQPSAWRPLNSAQEILQLCSWSPPVSSGMPGMGSCCVSVPGIVVGRMLYHHRWCQWPEYATCVSQWCQQFVVVQHCIYTAVSTVLVSAISHASLSCRSFLTTWPWHSLSCCPWKYPTLKPAQGPVEYARAHVLDYLSNFSNCHLNGCFPLLNSVYLNYIYRHFLGTLNYPYGTNHNNTR